MLPDSFVAGNAALWTKRDTISSRHGFLGEVYADISLVGLGKLGLSPVQGVFATDAIRGRSDVDLLVATLCCMLKWGELILDMRCMALHKGMY